LVNLSGEEMSCISTSTPRPGISLSCKAKCKQHGEELCVEIPGLCVEVSSVRALPPWELRLPLRPWWGWADHAKALSLHP
jgi:hypothetical protein